MGQVSLEFLKFCKHHALLQGVVYWNKTREIRNRRAKRTHVYAGAFSQVKAEGSFGHSSQGSALEEQLLPCATPTQQPLTTEHQLGTATQPNANDPPPSDGVFFAQSQNDPRPLKKTGISSKRLHISKKVQVSGPTLCEKHTEMLNRFQISGPLAFERTLHIDSQSLERAHSFTNGFANRFSSMDAGTRGTRRRWWCTGRARSGRATPSVSTWTGGI